MQGQFALQSMTTFTSAFDLGLLQEYLLCEQYDIEALATYVYLISGCCKFKIFIFYFLSTVVIVFSLIIIKNLLYCCTN